jgi:hypothetical protein
MRTQVLASSLSICRVVDNAKKEDANSSRNHVEIVGGRFCAIQSSGSSRYASNYLKASSTDRAIFGALGCHIAGEQSNAHHFLGKVAFAILQIVCVIASQRKVPEPKILIRIASADVKVRVWTVTTVTAVPAVPVAFTVFTGILSVRDS